MSKHAEIYCRIGTGWIASILNDDANGIQGRITDISESRAEAIWRAKSKYGVPRNRITIDNIIRG